MSLMGVVISFFPVLYYGLLLYYFKWVIDDFTIGLSLFLFHLILFPVLVFRLHNLMFPLKAGVSDMSNKGYVPWYGSYCIQRVYHDLKFIESILRSLPGVYSFWLRLWGAKIGKGVHWTPNVQVLDRSLIDVGNNVFFGHEVGMSSHIVKSRNKKEILVIAPIQIGEGSFIGARTEIFPGAIIKPHSRVNFNSQIMMHESYEND